MQIDFKLYYTLLFPSLHWTLWDTWIALWMDWEVNGVLISLKLFMEETSLIFYPDSIWFQNQWWLKHAA